VHKSARLAGEWADENNAIEAQDGNLTCQTVSSAGASPGNDFQAFIRVNA